MSLERRKIVEPPSPTTWLPSSPSTSSSSSSNATMEERPDPLQANVPESPNQLKQEMQQAQRVRRERLARASQINLKKANPEKGPVRPTEVTRVETIKTPSKVIQQRGKRIEPLLHLSQDEIGKLVWDDDDDDDSDDQVSEVDDDQIGNLKRRIRIIDPDTNEAKEGEEEDPIALWEELVNALLWTIPFAFLFVGMDHAVHAQYGQDLASSLVLDHLSALLPTVYLLNFLSSRPLPSNTHSHGSSTSKAPFLSLPPRLIQPLLALLCLTTGIQLVHTTSTDSYLRVMSRAPALGTLWVWSVVKMDLGWAVASLTAVVLGIVMRGELSRVKWWV